MIINNIAMRPLAQTFLIRDTMQISRVDQRIAVNSDMAAVTFELIVSREEVEEMGGWANLEQRLMQAFSSQEVQTAIKKSVGDVLAEATGRRAVKLTSKQEG